MTQATIRSIAFRVSRLAVMAFAVMAIPAACGGGSGADGGGQPDSLPQANGRAAPSEPASDRPAQDTPYPDTAGGTADGGQSPAVSPGSGWSTEASVRAEGGGSQALLTEVRTARHDGYDRIVFEFEASVPAYEVQYVSGTIEQCGSGRPAQIEAPVGLQVIFPSAAAHNDQGRPTISDRSRQVSLPVLQTAHITCDFEGRVEWALGLERRVPFRAFVLQGPPRVVVDLQHP